MPTAGEIKRERRDRELQEKRLAYREAERLKKSNEAMYKTIVNSYKQSVLEAYTQVFGHNYDDQLIYSSVGDSLNFYLEKDKNNNMSPTYTFNPERIKFISDLNEVQRQNFNQNEYSDFISNDKIIEGSIIDNEIDKDRKIDRQYTVNNSEIIDGQFQPTSSKERFGAFQKITKLGGFSTIQKSNMEAQKLSEKLWKKQSVNVLTSIVQNKI